MREIERPKKIILVVIDCLRADHLGCYGYKRDTSPNIDGFASESVFFKWAFSSISYTCPSFASMLTSLYPSRHSLRFQQKFPKLDKDKDLLISEVLKSLHYSTAFFAGGIPLREDVGLNSGFELYDCQIPHGRRSAEVTNKRFFEWLNSRYRDNFFALIHYYDVHLPYIPPYPLNKMFVNGQYATPQPPLNVIRDGWGSNGEIPETGGIPKSAVLFKKGKVVRAPEYYIAQYDGCIKYVDNAFAELVARLRKLRIYDDCLLMITGDHGEAMGENNVWFYHGLTVTPDQIHVPLMIKPHSGWNIRPRIIETQVSHVDIVPTISELVSFDYSGLDIDGKSLVRLSEEGTDKELESRTIISEIEGQIAYIDRDRISVKPKRIDKDKLAFFYVEDLCNKEMSIAYRRENNMLQWAGVGYVSLMEESERRYEDLHRYRFAKDFVKGKKVLDLACGEGYGSLILSKVASEVIGIDIDEATIRHASSKYPRENLKFIIGSMADIPIEGEKIFDVIVCFKALKHVEEHDRLLKEVKRLLKADGMFIVSMPNKYSYTDQPNLQNPFHLKELYFDEFRRLVSKNFKSVFLLEKGDREFLFASSDKKLAGCFIAAASDSAVDKDLAPGNSYLLDISETLFQQKDAKISHLEALVGSFQETLNHIYNSHGRKRLLAYYRFIEKILLIGSKRWKPVQIVWGVFWTISVMMRNIRKEIFSKTTQNYFGPHQEKYYMIMDGVFPPGSRRRKAGKFALYLLRKVFSRGERTSVI